MSEQSRQNRLQDKVAVVTGGSRGLGRAFALALAKAGASVALLARDAEKLAETSRLIEKDGGQSISLPVDVTSEIAVLQAFSEIETEFGAVDLLINNSGVMAPIGMDWEVDSYAWWRTMEINVRGPYLCARAALPGMVRRKQGRIINISSMVAWLPMSFATAYAASKAALSNMTASLAAAVREHNIAVLAYGPGYVLTDMGRALAESPEVEKYAGSFYRDAVARGWHVALEKTVPQFMRLATGEADALSGCHLDVEDDIEALVARADEIRRAGLYTLSRQT